jgi:hypothetical protein
MSHNDNQNMTVLKEAWLWPLEVAEINEDLIEKIRSHTKWDKGIMEDIRDGMETGKRLMGW